MIARRLHGILVLRYSVVPIVLLLSLGCSQPTSDNGACAESTECAAGYICGSRGSCVQVCNSNSECQSRAQSCVHGVCITLADATCASAADCTEPGPCGESLGMSCDAGVCHYPPRSEGSTCDDGQVCTQDDHCDTRGNCIGTLRLCETPPANECLDASTYRSYGAQGACAEATSGCTYDATDVACPDCVNACLDTCRNVRCTDTQGGCRTDGRCVPGNPPTCAYSNLAYGTLCDLPGSPTNSKDGVCNSGACVECLTAVDCKTPPSAHAECFTPSCEQAHCVYAPQPTVLCEPLRCQDGYISLARSCGATGDCPDAGALSCHGFNCAANDLDCLTTCTTIADCLPGLACNAAHTCTGLLPDGGPCMDVGSASCESGYCDGKFCCSAGDCCRSASDCPSAFTSGSTCNISALSTDCQGAKFVAACNSYQCESTTVDDDSGCKDLEHGCPNNFASLYCSSAVIQPPPVCKSTCSAPGDCADGFACSAGTCVAMTGLGSSCTGVGQGTCSTGLKCQNSVCCGESGPTCCATSTQCGNNLACNGAASACFDSCNDYDASRCAAPSTQHCLGDACVTNLANGSACTHMGECQSGLCVEGVCCNSSCSNPCESCLAAKTGGITGTCTPKTNGTVCRSAAGDCDATETCNGSNNTCPTDAKSTAVCRASAGACDLADVCNGTSNACPPDAKSTSVCRAAVGTCDLSESCNGSANDCPVDAKSTAQCRASTQRCDPAEVCNGSANTCPADSIQTPGFVNNPKYGTNCQGTDYSIGVCCY